MKYHNYLIVLLLSSCVTVDVDQREIIPELFDPELKRGKIFIFSNHADIGTIHIRVNDEEREKYLSRKDFRRHHKFNDLKAGLCDNTVKMTDPETGKIIFRCGGHTSAKR